MKSAIGTRENIKVIESFSSGGLRIEVMEYQKLLGLSSASMATAVYYMEKQKQDAFQQLKYKNKWQKWFKNP